MPAERGRRRLMLLERHPANCIGTATMRIVTRISIGRIMLMTTVSKTFRRLAATSPTGGDFTICMETYLNGARTGTGITPVAQRVTLSALRTARPASGAVVPGATRRTMPVPQIGAASCPPTAATTSWASASVSDCPVRRDEMQRDAEQGEACPAERPEPTRIASAKPPLPPRRHEAAASPPRALTAALVGLGLAG